MDQVLYGIDYIEYYFYWIYYKFIGYPLIIRICSIAVMFLYHYVPTSCYFISHTAYSREGKKEEI